MLFGPCKCAPDDSRDLQEQVEVPMEALSRRNLMARGFAGAAAAAVGALAFACRPVQAVPLGTPAGADRHVVKVGNGRCTTCAQEYGSGQRAGYQVCTAFAGAYDGASICQRCSHNWYYHA